MDDNWVTMTDAAQRLKRSYRSIQRWVSSGQLESRHTADGRLLVRVTTPDTEADRQIKVLGAAVAVTSRVQDQAESMLAQARQDARSAQRWGTAVSIALFVVLAGGVVGAAVASATVAGQRVRLETAAGQAEQLNAQLAEAVGEGEALAVELDHAQADAERTRGELRGALGFIVYALGVDLDEPTAQEPLAKSDGSP